MSTTAVYYAPMEGVTDPIYRRVHHRRFPGMDKYFIPFISPARHLKMNSREQRAVSPVENAGVPAVPQVLTQDAQHLLNMVKLLSDVGYTEINLNLGCPSGTVTAKGKGSGMLRDPDALRRFLDAVYAHPPANISIKTRIGYADIREWEALSQIYLQYPIYELTVHARTREEFYKGHAHRDAINLLTGAPFPVVYNGDLFTVQDMNDILRESPMPVSLMLGRGITANPALAREFQGGKALTREELIAFHDDLFKTYAEAWSDNAVLGHMREISEHLLCCFDDVHKIRKAIRKARTTEQYANAMREAFETRPFLEIRRFYFPFSKD